MVWADLIRGLPEPGTYLEREHKGRRVIVKVLANGFEFDGQIYRSLSAIAGEVTGTKSPRLSTISVRVLVTKRWTTEDGGESNQAEDDLTSRVERRGADSKPERGCSPWLARRLRLRG